jgi:hypothetical protein
MLKKITKARSAVAKAPVRIFTKMPRPLDFSSISTSKTIKLTLIVAHIFCACKFFKKNT